MENYKASIELISGLKQKNGGNFPLMEANAIQVDPEGKRLDDKLSELDNKVDNIIVEGKTYKLFIVSSEEEYNNVKNNTLNNFSIDMENETTYYYYVLNLGPKIIVHYEEFPDHPVYCDSNQLLELSKYVFNDSNSMQTGYTIIGKIEEYNNESKVLIFKIKIGDKITTIPILIPEGITPHIGEDGNWWIGETNTGIAASSEVDASTIEASVENYFIKNPINIPTNLSDLNDDTTHRVVTDEEKNIWNNRSNFSGSYEDLTDKPIIPNSLPASDVYDWAKEPTKPTYTADEVGALSSNTKIPTKTSDLENDSNFLTEHQSLEGYVREEDLPTTLPASDVHEWAKAETKPTYTAEEVGALPASTTIPKVNKSTIINALGYTPVNPDEIPSAKESWEQISYSLNDKGEAVWAGSDELAYSKICAYVLTNTNHGQSAATLRVYLHTNYQSEPQLAHAHTISEVSGKSIAFRFESDLKGYVSTKSVAVSGPDPVTTQALSTSDIIEGIAPLGLQSPIEAFKIGLYNSETPVSLSGHYIFIYGVRA